MRLTHRPEDPRTVMRPLIAALLAAIAASLLLPIRVAAQTAYTQPLIFDQYLSRARLDESIVGDRTRLDGIGFRLTRPLGTADPDGQSRLLDRVALGGFVTYAQSRDSGLTAWHFGAHADVPLRASPLPAPVEPLASLSIGAFRARLAPRSGSGPSPRCVVPTDLAFGRAAAASCIAGMPRDELSWQTHLTMSPAAGVRVALGRGLGLRTDVRDVVVFRGAARHNFELATGLSFVR